MLNRKNIFETIEKNRNNKEFIFSMIWDIMYKQMLSSLEGMPFLEAIVSTFTDESLEEIKGKVLLLSTEILQNSIYDQNSKADITIKYKDKKYIVEMNSSSVMIKRNMNYIYKVAGSNSKIGDKGFNYDYETVLINFNSFDSKQKELCKFITFRDEKGEIFDDSVKIYNVNMEKASDKRYTYRNEKEELISIICKILTTCNSSELFREAEKIMSKDEAKNFVKRAKELSSNDEMIKAFDDGEFYEAVRKTEIAQSHNDGVELGIEKGIEKGSKEKAIEIAKKLKLNGVDINIIAQSSGLSVEEIKNLK